ncbi:LAME_0E00496g1_1 [Lachancea meyersii CBS 8951]|uniref:LAME_0E00496g1_1 n=1 Tax=Lachancea meyersii CBS 8951 TaxID=1266667 RepID=A0A1G4JEK4_9SACH|nr:LAME_0E00496g1_1 [Lachancea meyersii CBS 8951]
MDFSLLSSLSLAMDTMAENQQCHPLKDLPVFKTLDESSTHRSDSRSWKSRPNAVREIPSSARKPVNTPPLAAYSASAEQPFYPRGNPHSSSFNAFEMQLELHERQLQRIRSIGWDSIRPIGVDLTLREREEIAKIEAKEKEEEERNYRQLRQEQSLNDPFGETVASPTPRLQTSLEQSPPPPDMDINLDQDVQEDETSYDYDDEFARIDGEEEQPSALAQRNTDRPERIVQQFIETSHIEGLSHPYDVENTYNGYDYDEVDSHEGTQPHLGSVPSLLPPIRNTDLGITAHMTDATPVRNPILSRRRQERRVTFDSSDCE